MTNQDILQIIENRKSTRAFLNKEVSVGQLEQLMRVTTRAPSWKNAQSYKVYFITGAKKQELVEEFYQAAVVDKLEPQPVYAYEKNHPSFIKKRMFALGMDLYSHMGIDRKDKLGREDHFKKNFRGFDAPVMAFFYIPAPLGEWSLLDLGILLGHICLVAESMGLATCAQASLAIYPQIVAKYTKQNESMKMILGMALGYADPQDKNNSFRSERAPLEEVMEVI